MDTPHRRCVTCLTFKPVAAFLEARDKCNRCRRLGLTRSHAEQTLRWVYPLAAAAQRMLRKLQDGRCAICQEYRERLLVDHDPATGFVRGLLCHSCNHALGRFRDDPERLRRAIVYLTEPTRAAGELWPAALREEQLRVVGALPARDP